MRSRCWGKQALQHYLKRTLRIDCLGAAAFAIWVQQVIIILLKSLRFQAQESWANLVIEATQQKLLACKNGSLRHDAKCLLQKLKLHSTLMRQPTSCGYQPNIGRLNFLGSHHNLPTALALPVPGSHDCVRCGQEKVSHQRQLLWELVLWGKMLV